MLDFSGMDCVNYSATLYGWASNANVPSGTYLGAISMHYGTNAVAYRNYLVSNKGWTIAGDIADATTCGCFLTSYSASLSLCSTQLPYLWNGQTLTTSGTYYDTLINVNGCDSLLQLNLTINSQTTNTLNQAVCNSYYFNGQTLTSSGVYYDTLMNANGCDSLITLNLTINNSSSNVINQTACNNFFFNGQTLTSSGVYYDTLMNANGCDSLITLNLTINNFSSNVLNQTAGVYYDTLMNVNGCDSIITLNLTVNTPNTSVTQAGANLTSNATSATYQWLSCPSYSLIVGETNQSFTATANGDYAVAVTVNGCTDTSACYTVIGIGIQESNAVSSFSVYPNPVSNTLYIQSSTAFSDKKKEFYNAFGQILFTTKSNEIDVSTYSKGIYYLKCEQHVVKVVVE
jgi:hypothetical protein